MGGSIFNGIFSYFDHKITVGMDNGAKFCMRSQRKLEQWNHIFKPLNTSLYAYEPGKDIRKNLIEIYHLSDDQDFLSLKVDSSFIKNLLKTKLKNILYIGMGLDLILVLL